ncbi:poly(A) RNA polymerase, mitochondrial [Scleropages formosus]|uniref:Mitochondrial poly(A) polymerase n=1 Tax=Scleropages formosus TaxID=113540 RepID=A0A8C9SVX0_SCLFO|nr:poly(A) RNA polymerase, mitochondrial [Scleropages formosus]
MAASVQNFSVLRGPAVFKRLYRLHYCSSRRASAKNVVVEAETSVKKDHCETGGKKSFYDLLEERGEQAARSLLISCPSNTCEKKFLKHMSTHGDINKYFFYESFGTYAVVEFAKKEGVFSVLERASLPHLQHEAAVPFKSRLLSLKTDKLGDVPNSQKSIKFLNQTSMPVNDLIKKLSKEDSIDQQLYSLTEAYQLTEENIRLRFLVCSLLKDIAASYFPECSIKPFGSSVNGFGKLGCDLDMFLDLDGISEAAPKQVRAYSLEYQLKRTSTERAATQSILSVIGECVDQFGPGCVGMQKILNARCPLVRFSHQPSGFQCDLTANNRVAMKSSELLYLYGQLDERVRALVFSVRCWARVQGITSNIPGAWLTNFTITVMVIFFLQKRSPPMIPILDHLQKLAGPMDKSTIDGNDCTFVSDLTKVKVQNNTETLEHLLPEFFEFYGNFDFNKLSINIRKGKEQTKTEASPLHIQNPFEQSLNVSRNVNATQLQRFVLLCQESAWLVQQNEVARRSSATGNTPWGLAALLVPLAAATKGKKRGTQTPASRIKGLLESLKSSKSQASNNGIKASLKRR